MLDPMLKTFMDMLADFPAISELSVAQVRKRMRTATRVKKPLAVERVTDMTISTAGRRIGARCYRPAPGPLPGLVFFHGGGWTVGDLDTHDDVCRRIAREAGCVVIAVDYRLAPEHPFPAAVDDASAALYGVAEQAQALGIDAARLVVGGDSAGGNLSLIAALHGLAQGGPAIAGQWLLYPSCDLAAQDTESYRLYSAGLGLSRADVHWFAGHYLPDRALLPDPRVSPLRAPSLAGLPPTYIGIAEHDVLRDEGWALARRLQAEGVKVVAECFADQIHGFANYATQVPASGLALSRAIAQLRQLLNG
jgi:acetyl esterase